MAVQSLKTHQHAGMDEATAAAAGRLVMCAVAGDVCSQLLAVRMGVLKIL